MSRVSTADRIRLSNRAEVEIMRYADDHAMWHKHVHDVELDPMQLLRCIEMDANPNTIDFSCRRGRKTSTKELYNLKFNACHSHQELGIFAPRLQQSQSNINYHLEAIRRSPILKSYLAYKSGREQLRDTSYQFVNQSKASCYGIMSQIDGDGLTCASLEEIDDMPADRLYSRLFPMLAGTQRLGAPNGTIFKPQVRITGVFKGADTLSTLIAAGAYHVLPVVNVYMALEMGILDAAYIAGKRTEMTEGEYIRQYLCKNVSAQNHIWEKYIRNAMQVGLQARLEIAEPMPGMRYKKRGLITFGYDHSGHGESLTASKSALVVCEQIGNFITFPFVKTWPAGTDDKVVEMDMFGLWQYFRPDYACGDAYGVGMLTSLNDRLFANDLTEIDRRTIGDGQSTASTWNQWTFAPIRFEGMTKHSMATALRAAFHNGNAAIPYFDDSRDANGVKDKANMMLLPGINEQALSGPPDWIAFVRQLGNIKALPTKASYSSYKMANPKLGDDLFDAACAGVWALVTRGESGVVETVISSRVQTREQLLGQPARPAA
ncbi:MAG TPA: hypothetical protein VK149_03435 [Sideroxyarcus sp.]|nr:hypothetical protein [Sideroxyarcus sp.]